MFQNRKNLLVYDKGFASSTIIMLNVDNVKSCCLGHCIFYVVFVSIDTLDVLIVLMKNKYIDLVFLIV